MTDHKFLAEELDAQADIKADGYTAILLGVRKKLCTEEAPLFGAFPETPVFVLNTKFSYHERASSLVQAQDKKVLLSTEGVTTAPTTEFKMRIGSTDYEIVSVDPLAPADTPILWKVHLRI